MTPNEIWSQKFYPQKTPKWILLIVSVILAGVIWSFTAKYYEKENQERFSRTVNAAVYNIQKHISKYELALRASVGMIQASDAVTREEWRDFIQALNLNKNYPGLQGIGLSVMLKPDEIGDFEKKIRSEDLPSFSIFPLVWLSR